ncbi:DUF2798 domain-containing protein [Citreimonas sp.]|uniref:DUF2798 domain-containing protein n=1 Tax=Citreimonas sp. TaxID=3036715 RepID=UPI0035C81E87
MFPPRFFQPLFALFLSGMMSCLVSFISTVRGVGLIDGLVSLWLTNWLASWAIAFPAVLVVAPIARRMVLALTRDAA